MKLKESTSFLTATFLMSVVDWGGEETARIFVRASDKVLVGMLQIEEILAVPSYRQRLVVGERQLEEDEMWSGCGVMDGSTVQLTIICEEEEEEEEEPNPNQFPWGMRYDKVRCEELPY